MRSKYRKKFKISTTSEAAGTDRRVRRNRGLLETLGMRDLRGLTRLHKLTCQRDRSGMIRQLQEIYSMSTLSNEFGPVVKVDVFYVATRGSQGDDHFQETNEYVRESKCREAANRMTKGVRRRAWRLWKFVNGEQQDLGCFMAGGAQRPKG